MEWTDRRAREVLRRVGEGQRRCGIQPGFASHQDGLGRIGGIALVGERQGGGSAAAKQKRSLRIRIEKLKYRRRRGLDRDEREWISILNCNSAARTQRGDCPFDQA